jgi:molybdopterin-guanine dinucleotide biosynthesis protein A
MVDRSEADAHSILRVLASAGPNASIRILLTGESGSGKTTWCSELVGLARDAGMAVGGVVSPGVYVGDHRVAIELWDVATDERRPLAALRTEPDPSAVTKRWEMVPEGLSWGNNRLRLDRLIDLLVVDELGPLEFSHGGGLQAALEAIDQGEYRVAVVVVRPSLLDEALKRWPGSRVVRIPVSGASDREHA